MFKRILIATDGSTHAKKAARIAAEMAAANKATLIIVSVSSPSLSVDEIRYSYARFARRFPRAVKDEIKSLSEVLGSANFAGEPYTSVPAPLAALRALADALVDEVAVVAKDHKVKKIERAALTGNAADAILAQAKASKADLIVMGTRGLSDLGGLIMGSVSHKVIHLGACACLTVK